MGRKRRESKSRQLKTAYQVESMRRSVKTRWTTYLLMPRPVYTMSGSSSIASQHSSRVACIDNKSELLLKPFEF